MAFKPGYRMLAFLKSLGLIVLLFVAAAVIAGAAPEQARVLGLVVLLASVVSIFKPQPKLYLKSRGFAAAVAFFVALPLLVANPDASVDKADVGTSSAATYGVKSEVAAAQSSSTPASEPEKTAATDQVADDAAGFSDVAQPVTPPSKSQAVIDHVGQLDREIASIPKLDVKKFTDSDTSIFAGTMLVGAWSVLYEQGASLPLDEEEQAKRQQFKKLASEAQAKLLPAMRDAYGPVLRQQLWEADGKARTTGAGYRTITITLPEFIRNANIKKGHEELYEMLMMLRFTRAEYKWSDHSEYSYYTLKPPADTQMGRWESGGLFIPIE